MKRIVMGLLATVAGLGVGGAGAWGVIQFAPQLLTGHAKKPGSGPTEFVPPVEVLAPLVMADGHLSGYETFEIQLEVPQGTTDDVAAKLPLLMNAVNLRTYRAPLAAGPDGMLPGLDAFRRVVMDAAADVYGKGAVRSVAVTKASPE
ncbi:hypothetical protein A8V01_25790 [Novosphingobium guangzhouense]|uniref:Flagellar basal body-associated protein FliL n=1 Tax=Novosphingobium guangzhouense TaxID=1850347 RepID=A0A2K2FVD1_9SPHN|nr:hypothetical protein A8V01_25790 [Novosphingobium guangzhouense]